MVSPWWYLFRFVALVTILYVLYRVLMRWLRRWSGRADKRERGEQCRCGYPLKDLDVARCPECGRVVGFDVTSEELGLTIEQLQRAQAARRARDQTLRNL